MNIQALLKKDPALYADMAAYLQNGSCDVALSTPTALWLKLRGEGLHAIAAFDLAEASAILQRLPKDDACVLRGCEGLRELAKAAGFHGCEPCWQVVYEKNIPLPVNTELTIRHPDGQDFAKVRATYTMAGDDELRHDFAQPDFLGGYLDGQMVGYIGLHSEGSMGLLHVFSEYRRRGYAEAIYATLINNQLAHRRIPFAQVICGNEPSLALQRKLGLTVSNDLIYWIWQ